MYTVRGRSVLGSLYSMLASKQKATKQTYKLKKKEERKLAKHDCF